VKEQSPRTAYPRDMPTLFTSWTGKNSIQSQLPTFTHFWQKGDQTRRQKVLYPSFYYKKEPGQMLGGCRVHTLRRGFSSFSKHKTLQLFVSNSKSLGGYTHWVHFFLKKSAHHSKDFFKIWSLQGFATKKPGTRFYEIKGNREAFKLNHEMLRGLSLRDPHGSPASR
jgi:hypothetical protein